MDSTPNEHILNLLESALLQDWPLDTWANRCVVLAVSGGADSVALARLVCSIRQKNGCQGKLVIAHYNHRLRGEESEKDHDFVGALAYQLDCQFVSERADSPGKITDPGVEENARNQRYDFFKRVANQTGSRFVVTAHHGDDQVETIAHRIARGTSIAGLCGIPRQRLLDQHTTIVRPLLEVSRAQLRQYLEFLGQDFREDQTNQSLNTTRNRIRLDILPKLRECVHASADNSIRNLARSAFEYHQLLLDVARPVLDTACRFSTDAVHIDISQISLHRPLVQRQVFLLCWEKMKWSVGDMSAEKWCALSESISTDVNDFSPFELPGGLRVERSDHKITIKS